MAVSWSSDWLCGLSLLVLTIVTHVCAIVAAAKLLGNFLAAYTRSAIRFVIFVAFAALATAALLSIEAAAWAVLYVWIGALPSLRAGMLYSLGAITSYGHATVFLEDRWQLLGAIEAVNGLILFGLATASLFAAFQEARPLRRD
jgi:hypothetical protein